LLRLRREDAAFRLQRPGGVDGSVLSPRAFALRFFTDDHAGDRLLIVNLGHHLRRGSIADPLMAPPADCEWTVQWSSEDPKYGGRGTPAVWPNGRWNIPAESALVMRPVPPWQERMPGVRRRTA
jgi:maltooligosyltrehalose trehalohydrolase